MSHPTSRKTVVILLEESTGATTTIHCPYTSPSTSDLRNLVSPYFPNTAKSHIGIFESNKDDNTFIAALSADPALLANLAMEAYYRVEDRTRAVAGLELEKSSLIQTLDRMRDTLETRDKQVADLIHDHQTSIARHQKTINIHESTISSNQATIIKNQATIDIHESTISSNQATIIKNQATLQQLETDSAIKTNDIIDLQRDVSALSRKAIMSERERVLDYRDLIMYAAFVTIAHDLVGTPGPRQYTKPENEHHIKKEMMAATTVAPTPKISNLIAHQPLLASLFTETHIQRVCDAICVKGRLLRAHPDLDPAELVRRMLLLEESTHTTAPDLVSEEFHVLELLFAVLGATRSNSLLRDISKLGTGTAKVSAEQLARFQHVL